MRSTLRALLDIVIRVVALVAADWVYERVYEKLMASTTDDADIGEGLLFFALIMAVAFVWSAWDGHHRGFGRAALVWLVTGVLAGGYMAFSIGIGDPGNTLRLMLSDLEDTGPFLAGLIVVPALAGAAIAASIRVASTPTPREQPPRHPSPSPR